MPRGIKRTTNDAKNESSTAEASESSNPAPLNSATEITLKNKKSEILDALHAALEREKKRTSEHYDPEAEEKRALAKVAVSETRQNVKQNIFSEELNQKFTKLELAIATEEEKLQNLYAIEKELHDITAIINAKRSFIADLEEEKNQEKQFLEDKIQELELEYAEKSKSLEKSFAEQEAELTKARAREKDEYEYKIKRSRAADNDAWEDLRKARELELSTKEKEIDELLKEASANKEKMESLEARVEQLPSELKAEYDKGYADATKELSKERQYAESLLKKDYEGTINRQSDKIKALEANLSQNLAEKKTLQEKLDHAYAEIKEMATKTVESTGGVKILGTERAEG